jgi:hypothetical protein
MQRLVMLQSPSFDGNCQAGTLGQPMRIWSLPKVFHTCGKNCGKTPRNLEAPSRDPRFMRVMGRAKPQSRSGMGVPGDPAQ